MGDRPHIFICEVEGGLRAKFDASLVTRTNTLDPISQQLNDLTERAYRYWNAEKTDKPTMEVLTTGAVTVKKAVSG